MSTAVVTRLIGVAPPRSPRSRTVRFRIDGTVNQNLVSNEEHSIWGSRTRSDGRVPLPTMEP